MNRDQCSYVAPVWINSRKLGSTSIPPASMGTRGTSQNSSGGAAAGGFTAGRNLVEPGLKIASAVILLLGHAVQNNRTDELPSRLLTMKR